MDVTHKGVRMFCVPTQFPALEFFVPHAKPHVVWFLRNHHHIKLGPNLGHGTCAKH